MFSRLDFWVTTASLLITLYAMGRALLGSLGRDDQPLPDSPAPAPRRSPDRPRSIGSVQIRRRKATIRIPTQAISHTVHTSSMDSMAQQEAVNPGMAVLQPPLPPIPHDDDTIPPYEPPPQPGPAADRDAAIRALVALGWKPSQIAENLKGDRNSMLKRIREIKAQS